jgi:hypothetical protein
MQDWGGRLPMALRMLVAAAIPLATLAMVFVPTASAAEVGQGTRELERLVRKADFDAAEKAAQKLLQSGTLVKQDVARVYLQLGIVAAAKRDTAGAAAAFRKALRLDGDLRLSSSVGPHVIAAFSRAKEALPPSTPADSSVVLTPAADTGELAVEAPARKDDGLARRVAVRIADKNVVRDLGAAPLRFSLTLPASVEACATAAASLLDEYGNELWPRVASAEVCRKPAPSLALARNDTASVSAAVSATVVAPPVSIAPPAAVVSSKTAAPSRSVSRATWVAAAATGAAAVGTTVLGIVALERVNEYNDSLSNSGTPEQQQRLRDLASTAQHRATGGAIVTALLAVTTVVFYISGRF